MTPLQAFQKKHNIKVNVFPGTNPNVTEEQVVEEIQKAFASIANGDYEEVFDKPLYD